MSSPAKVASSSSSPRKTPSRSPSKSPKKSVPVTSAPPQTLPTDEELKNAIRSEFAKADIATLTTKAFIAALQGSGPDLSSKKPFIKAELAALINKTSSAPNSPEKKKQSTGPPKPIAPQDHSGVYPLTVPPSLATSNPPTSTLLLQVEPKAIQLLDLGVNTAGAIGRLSTKDDHLSLNIKGLEYEGYILPCATCMFVKVDGKNAGITLEGITDEVCTLRYSSDTLEKMKSSKAFDKMFDDGEEDVNKKRKTEDKAKKAAAKKKVKK